MATSDLDEHPKVNLSKNFTLASLLATASNVHLSSQL